MVRQFRKQWLKWHGGYERRAFRIFQNTFKEIANGIPFDKITDNTYKDLIDFYVSIDKITEAYNRVYLDIGIVHGKRVGRQINQQINKKNFKPDDFTSKYQRDVNKWVVENGGKRIVSVRGNYVKYVNALIEKGLKENKSKRQIAADIQRLLKSRGFYRYESERIARTETTTASNYAATVSSSVSGVLMDKIWISALDNRTRRPPNSPFDHYDMNLKRVKLEDDFIVSGESMPFPAAPSGKDGKETSAGNVINCRCAVAQVVRTEQIEAPEPVIKEPVIQEVIPIIEEVEEVIDEVVEVFKPAKSKKEFVERMQKLGIEKVQSSKLNEDEYNTILKTFEKEYAFKPFRLDNFKVGSRKGSGRAFYRHSYSSRIGSEINVNLKNTRSYTYNKLLSFEDDIKEYEAAIKKFETNYLNNSRYSQSKVRSSIRKFKIAIGNIQYKIDRNLKPLPWSMSSQSKTMLEALEKTMVHEIGHARHYNYFELTRNFDFNKNTSITEYGKTNFKEYFTEWYTYWRYNGDKNVPKDLLELFKLL